MVLSKYGVLLSLIAMMFVLPIELSNASTPETGHKNLKFTRSIELNQKEIVTPKETVVIDAKQLNCLALNVYYEARGEGRKGMEAVAYVTINRTKSGKFPSSMCSVVYQRGQFSWTSARNSAARGASWNQSMEVARYVYESYSRSNDPTYGALYFHSARINPGWRKGAITRIGNHVFYR